jgi:hypothetical protein
VFVQITLGHFWNNPDTAHLRKARFDAEYAAKKLSNANDPVHPLKPSLDRQVLLGGSDGCLYLLDMDCWKVYLYADDLEFSVRKLERVQVPLAFLSSEANKPNGTAEEVELQVKDSEVVDGVLIAGEFCGVSLYVNGKVRVCWPFHFQL